MMPKHDKFFGCSRQAASYPDGAALIPKNWTVHNWSFPRYFPGWEKERKHEGIEVLGRPEGVHFEAGR